jgi:hypothetical protein
MKSNSFAVRLTRRAALLVLCSLALALRLVAAESVTLAITGDIYTPDAKVVSDALLAQKPLDAVLLVGDTCNGKTTPLEKYKDVLDGTYARFKPLIFPCPGNHDGYSKPAFSAYQAYWGQAAHAPEMYYSFDLGGWHIVSLDSVNFHDKKGGAKQLAWLKADLAANPKKPVIAYWHYPLFSRAKHCGDPKMKPLWQALEAHGPALVFSGHNHVYERFPALDAEGQPADAAKGVQQFVIGPGGAGPIKSEEKDAKGPASACFHGGAQHIGLFTLKPDGAYAFTIKSVAKDGTTAVVETGKGQLQPK